jgi:ABC-type iron transport system FetAB ATPase subunit
MAVEINSGTVIVNGETIAVAKKPKYKRGVPQVTSNTSLIGDSVRVKLFLAVVVHVLLYGKTRID